MSTSSNQNPSSTQNNAPGQSNPTTGTHPPGQSHPTTGTNTPGQTNPTTETHPSSQTHHSSQLHSSAQGHSTGHPHKYTIEQFAEAVNKNHLNNLDKYLDNDVQKTIDSQIIYKNLKEAQDYYKKEHTNNKTSEWKIINIHDDDQKEKKIQAKAKLTYNNKTYNTIYTFSSSGKIQHIDATLDK